MFAKLTIEVVKKCKIKKIMIYLKKIIIKWINILKIKMKENIKS